jgi:hypothetical protein
MVASHAENFPALGFYNMVESIRIKRNRELVKPLSSRKHVFFINPSLAFSHIVSPSTCPSFLRNISDILYKVSSHTLNVLFRNKALLDNVPWTSHS